LVLEVREQILRQMVIILFLAPLLPRVAVAVEIVVLLKGLLEMGRMVVREVVEPVQRQQPEELEILQILHRHKETMVEMAAEPLLALVVGAVALEVLEEILVSQTLETVAQVFLRQLLELL
jgi:hypothetical protein